MVRSKKKARKTNEKQQEEGRPVEQEDEEMEEVSDEEDGDDESLTVHDVEQMEKLSMDFEALPPHESDLLGLVNLITQIFLRTDIDCEGLAKKIIEQSPVGCIYKPTEECEDDDEGAEGLVYGTLSVIELTGKGKFRADILNFLIQKARKHAGKAAIQRLQEFLSDTSANDNQESSKLGRLGFVVNERMLHFPEQIAGPAFRSMSSVSALSNAVSLDLMLLKEEGEKDEDIKKMPENERYNHLLMIVKVRVSEENPKPSSTKAERLKKVGVRKKRLGKAAKKRLAAAKLADADVVFDNAEEELLFQSADALFQYPVHTDVEKTSKFHSTTRNGVAYRPYRRVCVLTMKKFLDFAENVVRVYSP